MKNPRKFLVNIGLRVKELRGNLALTQETLAEQVEMHRTYIARIEAGGASQVSIVALARIAETLQTDVAGLLQTPGDDVPKRVDAPKKNSRGRVTK